MRIAGVFPSAPATGANVPQGQSAAAFRQNARAVSFANPAETLDKSGQRALAPYAARAARRTVDRKEIRLGIAVALDRDKGRQASIEGLVKLVAADMERVNQMILSRTGSDVLMIPEVANHLISSGGKRLRPMLTLSAAALCGYQGEGHVKLAASVEFMHTATLLHDDVVDESDMRRGKPAARKVWGNEASVLVGDFLLGQAFRMMVEVGSLDALDVLSTAAAVIAEGEVMQLSVARSLATTEDEYLAVIEAKTATLFAAACEVGPILAGNNPDDRAACRAYGMNLGVAFQLIDDALDYGGTADALGKNIGDDFREGKLTLPVVLSLQRGDAADREFWRQALEEGATGDDALKRAVAMMRGNGALRETIARAESYGDAARAALDRYPAGPLKTALLDTVDFCISRAH